MQDTSNTAYTSLVIIMVLLLISSTISMFIAPNEASSVEQLDIIIRTALSSVFGFLISATIKKDQQTTLNETGNYNEEKQNKLQIPNEAFDENANEIHNKKDEMKMQTFEKANNDAFKKEIKSIVKSRNRLKNLKRLNMQIIIIASISFYCLFFLVLARNATHLFAVNSSTVATISQFRDFISSGIGALIGLSQKNKTN